MPQAFGYPGSKSRLAGWIISHIPPHECYVEPFCGSAAVLLSKDESTIEVINDINSNITTFFNVLRDRGDELADWLDATAFSREYFEEWEAQLYAGDVPDDPLEHAGRFVYCQMVCICGSRNFGTRKTKRDPTAPFRAHPEKLRAFSGRIRNVVIENLDYVEIVEKYDRDGTLFYFDPPYVDAGERLYVGEFDHRRFVECLDDIDGKWIVSYGELPDSFDTSDCWIRTNEKHNYMRAGTEGGSHDETDTERLIMNFDPDANPSFSSAAQTTLTDGGFDG